MPALIYSIYNTSYIPTIYHRTLTDAAPVDGFGAQGLDMLPDVLVLGLV
jgi:hypothetical protein